MTQKVISLVSMLLICGSVAAEPVKHPSKSTAALPLPAPKETKSAPKEPPANELFGSATSPAPLASRAIGSYARGCLAGGVALPINGPDWQVMRLSRNRNWGHPRLSSAPKSVFRSSAPAAMDSTAPYSAIFGDAAESLEMLLYAGPLAVVLI